MTRRFTAADLENLTEGTKPGPWKNGEYGIGPLYADIYGSVVSENQKDEELAAAAPELAADYHRVLTELEQLRDHARDVRGHNTTADDITRILNGETWVPSRK